ncbi:MAG TPA: alanine racemase, partial [Dehalococcoidia bacterium]
RELIRREGHRVWAEIDLDAIEHNVRSLCGLAGAAKLLAVVKGNAYGHGAVPVARAALRAGAWGLGVVSVDEGEELRRARIDGPVLVLGASSAALAPRLLAADLRVTVASRDEALALAATARAAGTVARVHLKVETGLNRFGLRPDDVVALAEDLRNVDGLEVEGIATHLASVDEGDKTFTYQQYAAFRQCAERLPWVPLHHISSTGALLDLPDLRLGLVRTGIGVYGYYPSDEVTRPVVLQPALSLRTRVARVTDVPPGESVGYGRTWTAGEGARVALAMAGYADGVRRALSNQGVALMRGQRAPFAGRVAMDMLMLDVSGIPDVALDDEVTLIGSQGDEKVDADEVGRLSGTISYEVLASVMARVPRFYVKGGRIVARQDGLGYRET